MFLRGRGPGCTIHFHLSVTTRHTRHEPRAINATQSMMGVRQMHKCHWAEMERRGSPGYTYYMWDVFVDFFHCSKPNPRLDLRTTDLLPLPEQDLLGGN
jgi:hypothetical protein